MLFLTEILGPKGYYRIDIPILHFLSKNHFCFILFAEETAFPYKRQREEPWNK
jgi:hypothetical protein